jgi:hypothetical protein
MNDKNGIRCLLVTPYSEEFHSLRRLIADALREIGIEPIGVEETMVAGTPIAESVQQAIYRADFIIADLTGSNPNIMYEVGFAHALRKPVLPIVQYWVGRVPSDIGRDLYLVYDPTKPDELRRDIQFWAGRYASKEKRKYGDE